MSDVPTLHLRFIEREVPAVVGVTRVRILQQLFETRRGPKWRDVPIVKEEDFP